MTRAVILLVDDDADFTLLVQSAFATAWPAATLRCLGDGDEAIKYLLGHDRFSDREQFPSPSLMLLDLKMPRVNGFEVLEWKHETPELISLPVVVWSSSNLPEDVQHASALGAVAYLIKPMALQGYIGIVERVKNILALPAEIRNSPWVWSSFSNMEAASVANVS